MSTLDIEGLKDAVRHLSAALIAVSDRLDTPYSNAPEWTPWSRFVAPHLRAVRRLSGVEPNARKELRAWTLPPIPDDLKLATTPDGRVYERDVERPDRWYLVYGNGARTGAWLRLGQLLDLAGPDGIREAVSGDGAANA